MNFLNRDEVLITAMGYLGLYEKNRLPQTKQDALAGIRRLWIRTVKYLRNRPNELQGWEDWMNERIRDSGGWGKISLTDESYLTLLDPLAATSPEWGRGILSFHENLGTEARESEVYLTPDSEAARNPAELASDLAENLITPLEDPFA